MDPLSIAGIGLGATSLVLQVFAGCVKGERQTNTLLDNCGTGADKHLTGPPLCFFWLTSA